MMNPLDETWADDDPEIYQRGIKDLESICQEWVEEFGPNDPLVVNLRRAIAEERQKLSSWDSGRRQSA